MTLIEGPIHVCKTIYERPIPFTILKLMIPISFGKRCVTLRHTVFLRAPSNSLPIEHSALDLVVNRRVISRASLGTLPPSPLVCSWTTQASTLGTPETPGEMLHSIWEYCHPPHSSSLSCSDWYKKEKRVVF